MYRRNVAGEMGAKSSQPAKRRADMTVDPLERLDQKMAGRMKGGAVEGKNKKKRSLMNSIGVM
jgi:hypothetical protein|tara:strand:+ start:101 stop:289 length:189 start_codon:yes stop_codon:yes gene_type:complete